MSRPIEDHIAELDLNQADPYKKYERLKKSETYKMLQRDLARKKEDVVKEIDKKADTAQTGIHKGGAQALRLKSIFTWDKDKNGEYAIRPKERVSSGASRTAHAGATQIAHFLGYRIDIGARVGEFKDMYSKWYIEARSDNVLLAKFAQLKFGMMQFVLSVLGIPIDELQGLQKKALKEAIADNETLFAQNEYNYELLTIFGTGRKDKARQRVLQELRKRLTTQMDRIGSKDYYTKERILMIKDVEVKKILQELLQERQTLEYLRDFR